MWHRFGKTRVLWLALAAGLLEGCSASPRVEFMSATSEKVEKEGRLEAFNFRASFRATGLKGEQLLYRVHLTDRASRPLRSSDGRYELKTGALGATRTLMVFHSDEVLADVVASIPARQLWVTQEQLPLRAYIGVYRATGERLAVAVRAVPLRRAEELRPPLALEANATKLYWFAQSPTQTGLPVLLGPFSTREEARRAVPGAIESPLGIQPEDSLWFVPIRSTVDPSLVLWCGPCASQAEGDRAAAALARQLSVGGTLEAGEAMLVPVVDGLAQRIDFGMVESPQTKAAGTQPAAR